ncbi:MAG: HDOD domain-containing protein [Pseudomonadales bacterium]|nr:HDOD domain-containing protein [Pseudomonadales bacterium]
MNRQFLIDTISSSTRLPVLSDTAARVIQMGNDPELYPAKLHTVLAGDPALAARILQVSNSAMFARQSKVSDLPAAIAVLGVRLTLNIALGLSVVDAMRSNEKLAFDYSLFWRKSVLSAIAANEMVATLNVPSRGELFVAALMQDLGMLIMLDAVGEKYARLVEAARSHFDLYELEWRVFGVDHAEIGAILAQRWQLPASIEQAIGNSHALFAEPSNARLSDLEYGVALAGILAEAWIAESPDQRAANQVIKAYLDKVGERQYKNTIESILQAIPGANEMFSMELLSAEQMTSVA